MVWTYHATQYRPHASQFITVNGAILRGGCTLLGLAAADIASKGPGAWVLGGAPGDPASVANTQEVMRRIYLDAVKSGNCQANGAARQVDMINQANRIKLPIVDRIPYSETIPVDQWLKFLRLHCSGYDEHGHPAPIHPVLFQFGNGQALHDALGGGADQWGLEDHAATCLGTQVDPANVSAGGYLFADGDSPPANERCSVYTRETLIAARPISLLAFGVVYQPAPVAKPQPVPAPQAKPVISSALANTIQSELAAITAALAAATKQ